TAQITFSEPLDTNSLDAGNVSLQNTLTGNFYSATDLTYDGATNTVTITFDSLPEGTYTLDLNAFGFRDLAGNPLDGTPSSPLPSGDGSGGDDYVLNFSVDVASTAYPLPLQGKAPPGSLIYDPVAVGLFNFTGDTDSYTIALNPGQRLTAVLVPLDG